MTFDEEMVVIAEEVAAIHASMETAHARLRELVARRDELLWAAGHASSKAGKGTVIAVPAAEFKVLQ